MAESKALLGSIGIAFGAAALLLALIHFYAGPFTPQPSIEELVAEKAVAIRDATIAALKGEESNSKLQQSEWDLDHLARMVTAVCGGIAVILAVIAFVRHESLRVSVGATVLGISALAFQFLTIALGAIILVILIAVVLQQIGIDV